MTLFWASKEKKTRRKSIGSSFKRFEKYGLSLHPEKTRLVRFGRPEATKDDQAQGPKPETFDFLGFTHYWQLRELATLSMGTD